MAPTAGQNTSASTHQQTRNGTKVFRIVVLGEGGVGKSGEDCVHVFFGFVKSHCFCSLGGLRLVLSCVVLLCLCFVVLTLRVY